MISMKFTILDWGADELEEEAKDLPIADLIYSCSGESLRRSAFFFEGGLS